MVFVQRTLPPYASGSRYVLGGFQLAVFRRVELTRESLGHLTERNTASALANSASHRAIESPLYRALVRVRVVVRHARTYPPHVVGLEELVGGARRVVARRVELGAEGARERVEGLRGGASLDAELEAAIGTPGHDAVGARARVGGNARDGLAERLWEVRGALGGDTRCSVLPAGQRKK